jgi:hypothetical protein
MTPYRATMLGLSILALVLFVMWLWRRRKSS